MSGYTGPDRRAALPSPSARLHELAMSIAARKPAEPTHEVEISRNAKGDMQFSVVVRGPDAFAAEQDAREIVDRLVRAYPHSSVMDDLKPMLEASVAEQKARDKTAAKAAAIARNTK